ncbi:MAG: filamentous hemagglutinin N-terminal domain-containing protein [Synechococcales bacterium]|nr:filamentous hemagglutinin N-terminal domain-containing protein [Synechococcales bacterium]
MSSLLSIVGCPLAAIAQIIPDSSLSSPSIVQQSVNNTTITGGVTATTNLFHSFQQFSVRTGETVVFSHPTTIQNIFTRVTGGSPSSIDGVIQAQGTANLFLLNPSGILFGPNARLSIGGSFIGSTANSIRFADGTDFSATTPTTTPLLTVSAPVGLQYGATPQPIALNGPGNNRTINPSNLVISGTANGLTVPTGQTLALVGGDLNITGGNLTAAGGRIELGSLKEGGFVTLTPTNPGWTLGYGGINQFGDIRFSKAASADVSASGAGEIRVQGRQVSLTESSALIAVTQGSGQGKGVTVRATEGLEIRGFSGTTTAPTFRSGIFSYTAVGTTSTARGGNTAIETGLLNIRDGGVITAATTGLGQGGNLTVKAQTIHLDGALNRLGANGLFATVFGSGTTTAALASTKTGNGGNLTIDTQDLRITNGARISTGTSSQGNGGVLTINAKNVEVIGETTARDHLNTPVGVSTIRATSNDLAAGNSGNLIINTENLRLADGGQIGSSSRGAGSASNLIVNAKSIEINGTGTPASSTQSGTPSGLFASTIRTGNAANITVNTETFRMSNGGQISTATGGSGNGGNITITAKDFFLTGADVLGRGRTGIYASAISAGISGINPTGAGGTIQVTADTLTLENQAQINISNFPSNGNVNLRGRGPVGNLNIQARSLLLDNARLTADSAGFNPNITTPQANITVSNAESIVLRNGSSITTNALGSSKGGNITLNTKFLVAPTLENSDITANAVDNFGGRVRITATSILGIEPRAKLTSLSDITASSNLGPEFSGTIEIDGPNVDPDQGLNQMPVLTSNTQVAATCGPGGVNQFIVTGRGGLPESAEQLLQADNVWQDFRLADAAPDSNASRRTAMQATDLQTMTPATQAAHTLVEAEGWHKVNGKTVLYAQANSGSFPATQSSSCHAAAQ